MARADSTIRVNIIGDAKSLQRATNKAEASVGGMNKKLIAAGGLITGAFVVENVVDFGNTAVKEADRVGDAAARLEGQLGDLAPPLIDAADEFARLGASEGDMLELQARFADLALEAGLAEDAVAALADDTAVAASAMALLTDQPADFWLDQIGKAADGSDRALRDLGIHLTDAAVEARALADTGKASADALTEGELAAARYALILEELSPRIREVIEGTGDLEQKQAQLDAKFETLTGKIGAAVEGPLNDLLDFVIRGIEGYETLAGKLEDTKGAFDGVSGAIKMMLGPIGQAIRGAEELIGVLQTAIDLWNAAPWNSGTPTNRPGSGGGSSGGTRQSNGTVTVNVQGGSPEVIEQSVRRALQQASGHGPLE